MAKPAKAQTSRTPARAPASRGSAPARGGSREVAAPDDLLKMMEADAGKGVSTRAEDNVVPLLYILQSNSPQLDRNEPAFIKNAKAGDFWVRGTQTIIDGEDEGVEFLPCYHWHGWIQWGADRGGYRGRHNERPKEARQLAHPTKPDRMVWRMPNEKGEYDNTCDTLAETIEYAGIITSLDAPVGLVLPLKSTGLTPAKMWMGLINSKVMPNGGTFPIYSHLYRLRTIPKKNDDGSWYQPTVIDAGGGEAGAEPLCVTDMGLYKAARKMHADFTSGALKADVAEDPETESGGDRDDM